ncbi:MAG: hypothetical protein L0H94_01110 [Nitrospira sp.]|nr:hypothetical protein [Nitrospira sp.]
MKPQSYGDTDAWFGKEDTPAPHHSIADPAPQLIVAVAATYPTAHVTVRYRRPNTSWQKLDVRKSRSSPQAQYYTALFPRTEPGVRVEYEVLVGLSATGRHPERRVGEVCWFAVAAKAAGQPITTAGRPSPRTTLGPARPIEIDATKVDPIVERPAPLGKPAKANPTDDESKPDAGSAPKRPERLFALSSQKTKRLACLQRCQAVHKTNGKLDDLFHEAEGDFSRLTPLLTASNEFDDATIRQLHFTNELADLTDDDEALVGEFLAHHKTHSLRDIALNLKKEEFRSLVGNTTSDPEKAGVVHDRLFRMAPKDVLHRMVRDKEFEEEEPVRRGLLTFFEANPTLDFRKDSLVSVLNRPDALKAIPQDHREKVVRSLKSFQRLSAVSSKAEAVPPLMKARLDSAYAVNEVPLERFVALYSESLGGEQVARTIHDQARRINDRNAYAWVALREAILSPTVHMVHGGQSVDARMEIAVKEAKQKNIPINFETLFGSVDLCQCEHCNSVYSPAAYLVELFQYLRNNNLVPPPEEPVDPDEPPDPDEPLSRFTGVPGIHEDTPLNKLFRRRPDLGRLQLTCENTNTLIPYIDLVNEVMESFVVDLENYEDNPSKPKQAHIAAHNVVDESSGQLLAEPQHINYSAYEILHKAVYPVCRLPYHQPIDAIRQYLKFLNTSRYELFHTFRKDAGERRKAGIAASNTLTVPFVPDEKAGKAESERLQALHILSVDRAIAAEYLGLTEEEYVILTKEGFHTREWYELDKHTTLTPAQYRSTIGLQEPWAYYGIDSENKMLNELKWVKPAQDTGMVGFLRRVNILYVDLIALLKTRYINPNYLSGRALAYMNQIPYSYRYLQTLVDGSKTDIKLKYQKVVELLQEDWVQHRDNRFDKNYIACWVYKYFAKIGKLIVLEDASACKCIEGTIRASVQRTDNNTTFTVDLYLDTDCQLHVLHSDPKDFVGHLDTSTGKLVLDQDFFGKNPIFVGNFTGLHGELGQVSVDLLLHIKGQPFICTSQETCDISKTQLKHLDGTDPVTSEYDRMHRFIRLWCKLGWSIAEVDLAITGVGETVKNPPSGPAGFSASKTFTFHPSLPPNEDDAAIVGTKSAAKLTNRVDRPSLKMRAAKLSPSRPASLGTTVTALPPGTDPKPGGTITADIPSVDPEKDCKPEPISQVVQEINPYLIDQLVAVKQVQERTGLELAKLLTFWTAIGTTGEPSLYERLFLQYNLIAIDDIFQDHGSGVYLTQGASISNHLPALMAAFKVDVAMLETIMSYAGIADALTLENVSHVYRHVLLAKLLGIRMTQLPAVFDLLKNQAHPFSQPTKTLVFFQVYERIDKSSFDTRHLNYLIRNEDDLDRPLAPETGDVFRLAISLRNALLQIETDHADIHDAEEATEEFLRSKLSLLFDGTVVDAIINLVQGTTVYQDTTRNKYTATLEESDREALSAFLLEERKKEEATPGGEFQNFLQRVQFSGERGLQVTGILSESDRTRLSELATLPGTADERDRFQIAVNKMLGQPTLFFDDVLAPMFPEAEDNVNAKTLLLAPDSHPENGSDDSASTKRVFLAQTFLPYLREQLRLRQVVQLLASDVGLDEDLTSKLVLDVIKTDSNDSLYQEIIRLREQQDPVLENPDAPTRWDGLFVPEQEGTYTFLLEAEGEASLTFNRKPAWKTATRIDDELIKFYESKPVLLKAGAIYPFLLQGYDEDSQGKIIGLFLKFNDQPQIPISDKHLFPALRTEAFTEAYLKLHKAAMLLDGFGMTMAELLLFLEFPSSFDDLNFNGLTFGQWLRLEAFYRLKKSLLAKQLSLIEFLRWTNEPEEVESDFPLVTQIHHLTGWLESDIGKLLSTDYFNLEDPKHFQNEVNLLKLQDTLKVEHKVGVGIDLLFQWGEPTSVFEKNQKIAGAIREAIRARYTQEEWEVAIKPVHDQLRESSKQALIAYLLAQPVLLDWGVRDADSLFEFFLIDVQMDACMETSRIKQAISSVQLYIQRCFLGLEDKHGVPSEILDRQRWEWMARYRVWEANRKVFLYPENWILPELRDDKSPFFKELESELLQNDVSQEAVQQAYTKYIGQVDEVANLEVVGFHVEKDPESLEDKKLHVVARTRNAPYFYYYRSYNFEYEYWYPWEKIDVDIPNITVENDDSQIVQNGSVVIPCVWNGRLFIFFPQLMQKTWTPAWRMDKTLEESAKSTSGSMAPIPYWEIKMAYSEYKSKAWTPKQLSNEAIYSKITDASGTKTEVWLYQDPDGFVFAPFIKTKAVPRYIKIQIYYTGKVFHLEHLSGSGIDLSSNSTTAGFQFARAFGFAGDGIVKTTNESNFMPSINELSFHYRSDQSDHGTKTMTPAQAIENEVSPTGEPYPAFVTKDTLSDVELSGVRKYIFSHPFTKDFLGYLSGGNIKTFFNNVIPISNNNYGSNNGISYHELLRPYAIYNWETYFHSAALLADHLSKSQRFEESMAWWHYIFDPINVKGNISQVWRFLPFRVTDSKNVLETIFSRLEPNSSDEAITEWRDNPFQPHFIARERPSAYMKWVVMKYIDNLIAWGDYLFRQDTIETLNQATQLYVLAGHILGARPEFIPQRGKRPPKSYLDLVDKWDAFSNAMVDLELIFPFSNQITTRTVNDGEPHYVNIHGFATALYFCIPDNPKLLEYWDTVADRLFKIRHCLNIEGVFRKLALFEPPIDPALLVQAAAQGLSISSVLNDLSTPMPNYRFNYLLARALEVTSEVKSLGNALLSALEKKDTESLSLLRAKHDTNIQTLVMEIRKKQLEEAQKTKASLEENRRAPAHRLEYYQKLADEEVSIPDRDVEFAITDEQLPDVKDESGMKLIGEEAEEIKKAKLSRDLEIGVGSTEVLASVFHAIPTITVDAKPFGIGPGAGFGGPQAGSVVQAVARGLQIGVNVTSAQSSAAGRKASHLRQLHDRRLQANMAGLEVKQIDKQITAQEIRIDLAQKEMDNHQVQIDQTKEVEDFLKSKFSNDQLYRWMGDQLKDLYYKTYFFAYDLAKKAEKGFRFEMGLSTSDIIKFGYWDSARSGLLAGEQLYLALKQLENAYVEAKPHDYEIVKNISLKQLDPLALIQLKETGVCEFDLREETFDLDYPGQNKRRIKTVSLSVPCVVGPYTNLNCIVRLLKHEYRNSKIAASASDYAKKLEEADERFVYNPIPTTAIAVSQGQNDSGVFELTFRDERYLPFEGAGAISSWHLELPQKFRQFDYQTISDVIVHLRYTSSEGGETLKQAAVEHLTGYVESASDLSQREGLFQMLSLKHEFPNEWHRFLHPEAGVTSQQLVLGPLKDRLPFFARHQLVTNLKVHTVRLFARIDQELSVSLLKSMELENLDPEQAESFVLSSGASVPPTLHQYVSDEMLEEIDGFWALQVTAPVPLTAEMLKDAWLVIKYQFELPQP